MCSQYARHIPISIELDFRFHAIQWLKEDNPDARRDSLALLKPIFEAVFTRIAPRIRHLTLIYPPSQILSDINGNFSSCSSLGIYDVITPIYESWQALNVSKIEHKLDVAELSCLKRVFLYKDHYPVNLPWSSITILDLEWAPFSLAFDALKNCVNLVHLNFTRSIPSSIKWKPTITIPIEHENLKSMIGTQEMLHFYSYFRFTRLRTLHLANYGTRDYNERFEIISKLPVTLESLTLSHFTPLPEHNLRNLFIRVPQLRELRFLVCGEVAIKSVIQAIGRKPAANFLPNLCKLSLLEHEEVDSRKVVDMLEALYSTRTRGESFHLEVSKIRWYEEASRKLESSGFNLEVTTGVEIPDGLPLK